MTPQPQNLLTSRQVLRLLDADIVIDLQRKHPMALAWYSRLNPAEIGVPGIVAMEMIQSARNRREATSADLILRPFVRVWPSDAACEAALSDFRALHLPHSLGLADALIAATAREQGAILCTFNVKHFRAVPGLATEQPYQR